MRLQQTPVSGYNAFTALPNKGLPEKTLPEKASPHGNSTSGNASIGSQQFPVPLFGVSGSWLGAMVPKRWAKRAVTRNMIKRKIYSLADSASTNAAVDSADAAYVVRLRSAFDPRLFKSATSQPLRLAVSQELSSLFAQGFQHD